MFLSEEKNPKNERKKKIYRFVRKNKRVGIAEIKEHMALAHATAVRVVDLMLEDQWLIEAGEGESSGGRKPVLYAINPEKKYIIGIELSDLYSTILLMNLNLEILSEKKLKMDDQLDQKRTKNFILDTIKEFMQEKDLGIKDLLGIGIGVLSESQPKLIRDGRRQLRDFKNWDLNSLKESINFELKSPVMIGSATNLAALVEYRKNYWKEESNVIFVSNDLVIRSSFILNGSILYRGKHLTENFGHVIVNPNGKKCACGNYGCLNAESSLAAIYKELIKRLKAGADSSLKKDLDDFNDLTYYQLLKGIEAADPLSLEVLDEAIYYFSLALVNLVLQFNPRRIILGGTLAARSYFFNHVKEFVEKEISRFASIQCDIQTASESFNTVAQGAGCLVIDRLTGETD